jgi:hypothetical protein
MLVDTTIYYYTHKEYTVVSYLGEPPAGPLQGTQTHLTPAHTRKKHTKRKKSIRRGLTTALLPRSRWVAQLKCTPLRRRLHTVP